MEEKKRLLRTDNRLGHVCLYYTKIKLKIQYLTFNQLLKMFSFSVLLISMVSSQLNIFKEKKHSFYIMYKIILFPKINKNIFNKKLIKKN